MNRSLPKPNPAHAVNEVLITEQLAQRPVRAPDYEAENRALLMLADEMANKTGRVLQCLTERALELCQADSTGISVLDTGGAVRWVAAAGLIAPTPGGTLPREASRAGVALERNQPLLFIEPARVFPALREFPSPAHECLIVPWEVNGKTAGTL